MKRIFFLYLFLLSLSASAQKTTRTATFNFNDLSSLNPSVPVVLEGCDFTQPYQSMTLIDGRKTLTGEMFSVSDFQNNGIKLHFSKDDVDELYPVRIGTKSIPLTKLEMESGAYMDIISENGEILKVEIVGDNKLGMSTRYALAYRFNVWTKPEGDDPVNVLNFKGSGSLSLIDKIIVTYASDEGPEIDESSITANYVSIPASGNVNKLANVNITFNELPEVTCVDSKAIYLKNNNNYYWPVSVASVAGSTNSFDIKFINIPLGEYTLVLPKGTFKSGDKYINEINVTYKVNSNLSYKNDYVDRCYWDVPYVEGSNTNVYTEDLKNILLFSYDWENVDISIAAGGVELRDVNNGYKPVAYGHLERSVFHETHDRGEYGPVTNDYNALRVVFDPELYEGDILTSYDKMEGRDYMLRVAEGTFGDDNFGRYINDPNSIDIETCHVNDMQYVLIRVVPKPSDVEPDDPTPDNPGGDNPSEDDPSTDEPEGPGSGEDTPVTPPVDDPVDPDPIEPDQPTEPLASTETITAAKNLLLNVGVGYPSPTSAARSSLSALVNDASSTEKAVQDAISVFYNTTDIEMPSRGKTYRLVNVTKNGKRRFLSYSDGSVKLSDKDTDAICFEINSEGSAYTFKTCYYNRFLHVFVSGNQTNNYVSNKNVRTSRNEATQLTIKKFSEITTSPADALGLVSLYGMVGKDDAGENKYAYSMVVESGGDVYPVSANDVLFLDDMSSAFRIEEAQPGTYVPFTTDVTVLPGNEVAVLDIVNVTFPKLQNVVNTPFPGITLSAEGTTISPVAVEQVAGTTNSFNIKFINVDKGVYTLNVPLGNFICDVDTIQGFTKVFTVTVGSQFVKDLANEISYKLPLVEDGRETVYIADLNEIIILDRSWIVNPVEYTGKPVSLRDSKSPESVLASGILEKTSVTIIDGDGTEVSSPAFKVVLDRQFKDGDLPYEGNEAGCTLILTIPETTFGDGNYVRYVSSPSAVDKTQCHINDIKEVTIKVMPEPISPIASDELIAKADMLLKSEGVGYPTAESAARKNLMALRDNYKAANKDYVDAINQFYNSNEIQKPISTKTYRIVNVAKDGSCTYLRYANGQVTVTNNAEKAYSFEAQDAGDKTVFRTLDDKYLHTLVNTDAYTGTSTKNVTSEKTAVNELSISRFALDGTDPAVAFGLVSIYGSIGSKGTSQKYAYSLVNTADCMVDMDPSKTLYFEDGLSSAFRIEEAAPTPFIPFTTEVKTDVATGDIDELNRVEISFPAIQNVDYNPDYTISLVNGVDSILATSVTKVSGTTNVFAVKFVGVVAGNYTLISPKGAFMCGEDTIQSFALEYNVTKGDVFAYDYDDDSYYHLPAHDEVREEFITSDLNDIRIYAPSWNGSELSIASQIVKLCDASGYVITTGRLIKSKVSVGDDDQDKVEYFALKILFDDYLEEGNLQTSASGVPGCKYTIVIPKAAFGDANFGEYLSDPKSVNKSNCHVNAEISIPLTLYPVPEKIVDISDIINLIEKYVNQ